MPHRAWLGLAIAVLCACGSTPRPTRARPTRADAPSSVQVRVTVLGGAAIDVGAVGDGWTGALAGGHRYRGREVGRGPVEVADDVVAAGLAGAVRHPDGWRFADRHGDLWASRDFLGPLSHAGSLGIRHFEVVPARGVIALLAKNRTRALLTSDGIGPAREACPFPVLSAAFVDARHGAVVADGGSLFRTEDGGTTWLAVASADRVSRGVDLEGDGIVVHGEAANGSATLSTLALDGSLTRRERGEIPAADPFEAQRTRAAFGAWAVADGFLSGPAVLLDEVAILSWLDGPMRVDLVSGGLQRIPDLPEACLSFPWSNEVLLWCRESAFVGDGRTFRVLEALARTRAEWSRAASEDASSVAFTRPHDEGGIELVVVRASDGRRFARRVDWAATALRAVHGTTVLFDRDGPSLALLDVESTSSRERRMPVPGTVHVARITEQGELLVSAIESDSGDRPRAVLMRGALGADALDTVDVPSGAIVAGLTDARNGLAVGETARDVWITRDGGERWDALAVASATEAPHVRWGVLENDHPIFCDRTRCAVPPTRERPGLVVVFERPRLAGTRTLRMASGGAPIEPADAADRAPEGNLACEMDPVADESGRALSAGAFATATATGTVSERRSRGARSIEVSWTGHDAIGAYRTVRARGPLPETLAGEATQPLRARPRWIDRSRALLELCRADRCETVLAIAGGAVQPWANTLAPVAQATDGALLGVALDRLAVDVSSVTGATSTVLRRLLVPDAQNVGITTSPTAALVARTPSGRWRLYPLDASRPPRAFPNVPATIAVCAGPALADAITVRMPGGPAMDGRAPAATMIELSRESACVRSIEIAPDDGEPVTFRGVLVASTGGVLEGDLVRRTGAVGTETAVREGRARAFRCRIAD